MTGCAGGDPAGPSTTGPAPVEDVEMAAECCGIGEAAEAAAAAGGPTAHLGDHLQRLQQGRGGGHGGRDWGLLAQARQLAQEGKPSLALQAVVMAVKTEGGEGAVLEVLHRARDLYRSRVQANAAAEELASLFAQCAIAEAHPLGAEPPVSVAGSTSMFPNIDEASILAESGRKQIMLDAFSDGSSFICLRCGGLVSNVRKQEHLAYWCPGQI